MSFIFFFFCHVLILDLTDDAKQLNGLNHLLARLLANAPLTDKTKRTPPQKKETIVMISSQKQKGSIAQLNGVTSSM